MTNLPENCIIQYLKKGTFSNGSWRLKKCGVILAMPVDENNVHIGISMCNDSDEFNKDEGLVIAMDRAVNATEPYKIKVGGFISRTRSENKFVVTSSSKYRSNNKEKVRYHDTFLSIVSNFIFRANKYYKNKWVVAPKFNVV